jgi:hypothetical protein
MSWGVFGSSPFGRMRRSVWDGSVLGLCFALLVLACDRPPREPENRGGSGAATTSGESSSTASSQKSSPEAPLAKGSAPSATEVQATRKLGSLVDGFRFPDAPRIVAIGDLHGDFSATERAFALAGATNKSGAWVGERLVVVQTGDQLDRGDDERHIIEFLQRIEKEAKAAGGAVIVLNGNHETMNVMGDFRYVTFGAMNSFASYKPASPLATAAPEQLRHRAEPFLPGGGMARLLARRPLIAMVGTTAFVHGGVLPYHVDYGIDRLNDEMKKWMLGEVLEVPRLVNDPEGPVWTRLYGEPELTSDTCRTLSETLAKLGAKRLVVGHTVQERGMSAACDDRVFRIDVGLSRYYGDHPVQVLEIKGDQVTPLTEGFRPEVSAPSAVPHN